MLIFKIKHSISSNLGFSRTTWRMSGQDGSPMDAKASNHLDGLASDRTIWRSSHLFGDSQEACLKTTCSEVDSQGAPSFNKARLRTTCSEVDSPGAPAFNKAGDARAWPDTSDPRNARGVEPKCSGPSLHVRPGGRQKVCCGDCGGSRP